MTSNLRHRLAALERQEVLDPSIRAMSDSAIENDLHWLQQDLYPLPLKRPQQDEFSEMSLTHLRAAVAALPPVSAASVRAMPQADIDRQVALLFAIREAELSDLTGE